MAKIHKEMLNISVSLGRHRTTEDAMAIGEEIRKFKPDIYVGESAWLPETIRKRLIIKDNEDLRAVRADRRLMPRYLKLMTMDTNPNHEAFAVECARITAETPGLCIFHVEGYNDLEIVQAQRDKERTGRMVQKLIDFLYDKRLDETLILIEDIEREDIKKLVMPRNKRISEGFERMSEELKELQIFVPKDSEVRVLASFGVLHAGIFEMLKERGLLIETANRYQDVLGLAMEVTLKLTKDPSMTISQMDRIRMLFGNVYEIALHEDVEKEAQNFAAKMKKAFERLGNEQGFMEFLRDAPRGDSVEAFKAMLRETLIV